MNDQHTPLSSWQLDQSAPEAYEQYLVPAIFESWTERLLDQVVIEDGDHVLDVACGTGIVARQAAPHVSDAGRVVGLDVNEGMVSVAKNAAAEIHPGIEWRQGTATDLPFDTGSFDVVCCQQALQFIDDPVAVLQQIQNVLSAGGSAVLSVWRPIDHQPGYRVFAELLERHVGDDAGTMMRSPFPDWDIEYLHTIAEAAGWEVATVTIEIGSMRYPSTSEFVRREAASSPLADQLAAIDSAIRNSLLDDMRRELDEYIDDHGVTTPMESYILQLWK